MVSPLTFTSWLDQADVPAHRLSDEQRALLQAAFHFRQHQGPDYYATRILSHFLLHCGSGLKVAVIARLLGVSRPTASNHQGLSAKQLIQQAHHRMDGRPYGKLLPRFAGPIAGFLLSQPQASRADLIDFVQTTFGVRVSRIALYHFLKRFGLDQHLTVQQPMQMPSSVAMPAPTVEPAVEPGAEPTVVALPRPAAAPPFSAYAPSMPAPSC
jgi:hypothetical protein